MINPKSLENLQTFDRMDTERHKELSRRGGLASAAIRKARKEEIEMISAVMKYGDFFRIFLKIANYNEEKLEKLIRDSTENHG